MIVVNVGFNVDDVDAPAVVEFLRVVQPILTAPIGAEWQLDLRRARYLGPTAAVVVTSCILIARERSQTTRVLLPDSPPALKAFCSFSGLQQVVQQGTVTGTGTESHPKNETVPLLQFRRMTWRGSEPVIQLTRRHFPGLGSESEQSMRTCYSEIAQNIEDHANSPIGGLLCARYFNKSSEVRIAISDSGVGIGGSLRAASARTGVCMGDDEEALRKVLDGNVSSKSRPNNMGQGVSILALIARGNGGRLTIFSGNAHAIVDPDGTTVQTLAASHFPGTLVALSLPVTICNQEDDEG